MDVLSLHTHRRATINLAYEYDRQDTLERPKHRTYFCQQVNNVFICWA